MVDLFKNVFWYIIERAFNALMHALDYILRAEEAYHKAVAGRYKPLLEIYFIRIKAEDVDIEPLLLLVVPDRFKNREMCEKAVKKYIWLLKYVPDWFVTYIK